MYLIAMEKMILCALTYLNSSFSIPNLDYSLCLFANQRIQKRTTSLLVSKIRNTVGLSKMEGK